MTIGQTSEAVIFRPFAEGVTGFTLNIRDTENNQSQTLAFSLKDRKMMPAKYINRPVDISPDGSGSILIESAVFTNTGSSLQIRLSDKSDEGINITPETRISLLDGAYSVLSRSPPDGLYSNISRGLDSRDAYPAYTEFQDEGITLARVDFEPVRSLDSNITLSVKGLYRSISPRMTIDSADLFDFARKGVKELPLDDFNLIIEGMQLQGSVIALVMHGEDSETHDRIEVKASIDLHAKDQSGGDLIIKGDCKSGPRGTDILFKVGSNPSLNIDPQLTRIKINSIETVSPDINVVLKLSELDSEATENFSPRGLTG
jgi:hypothetical protein